jgi:hypothetical protein
MFRRRVLETGVFAVGRVAMAEVNLLSKLPRGKRNVNARGSQDAGDHRYLAPVRRALLTVRASMATAVPPLRRPLIPVAEDIVKHFDLSRRPRARCRRWQGFWSRTCSAMPGLEAFGLDISEYALMHCEPEVVGRLHLGSAVKLPFPDNSFKAVISLNTIHNLERADLIIALKEIERLAPGRGFVQVDSYRTPEQKALFEEWVLTAKFHDYPDGWVRLFEEAGYTGDYY